MADLTFDHGPLTVRMEKVTMGSRTDPESGETVATVSGTMTITELRLTRAMYEAMSPATREKYAGVIVLIDEEMQA